MGWLYFVFPAFQISYRSFRRVYLVEGQMISECPYEIIVCPKIATKTFPRFLPWPLRRGQIKNFIIPIMLNTPSQCGRRDLNKRFLPKPMTTTG